MGLIETLEERLLAGAALMSSFKQRDLNGNLIIKSSPFFTNFDVSAKVQANGMM